MSLTKIQLDALAAPHDKALKQINAAKGTNFQTIEETLEAQEPKAPRPTSLNWHNIGWLAAGLLLFTVYALGYGRQDGEWLRTTIIHTLGGRS